MFVFPLFFFLFGLCIGSFLNVVIYRYNTGLSINGRSQCFSCSRTLAWYDLIPVFSFLAFRGRCRTCGSKISVQYPAVELLVGCLFLALYFLNGVTPLLFLDLVIWSILVVILVYDLRHKIIPDIFVAMVIIFGYIRTFSLIPYESWFTIQSLWVLLAGPILFVPFYLLWKLSNGTWMGLGDGKLAIAMGAILGLALGISAITLSFWIGAVVMLLYLGIQKLRLSFSTNKLTMKSEIPFAPFLIIGLWIVFYFQINVLMIGTFLL